MFTKIVPCEHAVVSPGWTLRYEPSGLEKPLLAGY